MKLYIKQKVFSWKDKFDIFDENGNPKYYVEGEAFSFGKKLHVFNSLGSELAFIHQTVLSFKTRFSIACGGSDIAEVVKEITFFKPKFTVNGLNWNIIGDFWEHNYQIESNGRIIATIAKHWMTWGDTYEIDIADKENELYAICVVIVIDAILAIQAAATT